MTQQETTTASLDRYEKPTAGLMGIYKITNTKNGRVYVGATTSFSSRMRRHIDYLNAGRHECREMVADWDANKDFFTFGFLEFVDKLSDIFTREDFWIKKLHDEGVPLYNRKKNLGNPRTHLVVRPETRARVLDLGKKTMDQAVTFLLDHYDRTK